MDRLYVPSLLVLDSRYRINQEDVDGYSYKFKLNKKIRINGPVRLEQFIFQNSQYVFSKEKKSDKFLIDNTPYIIEGRFENIDSFVKAFNVYSPNVKMSYSPQLYEIKVQHLTGAVFSFKEYYDDGNFMALLGYKKINEGINFYTNINIPRLFSQTLTYITIPELGVYNTYTMGSKPYTFLIAGQPGFEIVSNINNTFANIFHVSDREVDEITVQIRDNTGMSFVNNKGDSNFIMIMSY